MIVPSIAFDSSKNLGRAYNEVMERLRDDDWAVFLDHDAMFTTRSWFTQVEAAVRTGSFAALTAVTNRIGNREQIAPGANARDHDIAHHRALGDRLYKKHGSTVHDVTRSKRLISGVVIVVSKAAWASCGKFTDGFLGVDNRLHISLRDAGLRVGIMPGLYVYHWYRGP